MCSPKHAVPGHLGGNPVVEASYEHSPESYTKTCAPSLGSSEFLHPVLSCGELPSCNTAACDYKLLSSCWAHALQDSRAHYQEHEWYSGPAH